MSVLVRLAQPGEYEFVGKLTVRAYDTLAVDHLWGGYDADILDTATRAEHSEVLVAVVDDHVVGSVTYVGDESSPWSEWTEPGEAQFRLLAVASVAVLALLLYWVIQRSSLGLQIRSLASDEALAQVSGIRPLAVTVLIWFIAGVAGGLAGAFLGVGSSVDPLLGWRQFLFIILVVLVGTGWGLGGVIAVAAAAGVALSAMTLQFGEALYAELVLIAAFVVILKLRSRRLAETGTV